MWPALACSEEAIDLTGRRPRGELVQEQGAWCFRSDKGKRIALKDLSYIRFELGADLKPKYPLNRTLLLPGGQRLTGALLKLDDQSIEFAWSKNYILRRDQLVGIRHSDDWLPLVHEDFEAPLKSWQIEGTPSLDAKTRFFGKQSLRLDEAGQRLTRQWPPLVDGRVSFVFQRTKKGRWTIDVLAKPALIIDGDGVRCTGVRDSFGVLGLAGGFHALAIEWRDGILRFYVNDRCLGQTPMPDKTGVVGIRFTTNGAGGALYIDEMTVARRLPAMAMPKNDAMQDSVWLEQGEQVFGRLVAADSRSIVLDAKFGKRTFPWSQVRGIGFAEAKPRPVMSDAEIAFRPGPGCSADRLQVKLLRWEDGKLIVEHALLGELAIERTRLEMIRFDTK